MVNVLGNAKIVFLADWVLSKVSFSFKIKTTCFNMDCSSNTVEINIRIYSHVITAKIMTKKNND